jgi:hypothetical protein
MIDSSTESRKNVHSQNLTLVGMKWLKLMQIQKAVENFLHKINFRFTFHENVFSIFENFSFFLMPADGLKTYQRLSSKTEVKTTKILLLFLVTVNHNSPLATSKHFTT